MSRKLQQHDLGERDQSETRLRTLPPQEKDFDAQLHDAEITSGEHARGIIVRTGGIVGGEPSLEVLLVTAPDGPFSPEADVWSDPIALADVRCASADAVRARIDWAIDTSKNLELDAPRIEETWTFGSRLFRGDPDRITQLLDARLRLVRLAFEVDAMRVSYAQESGVLFVRAAIDAPHRTIVCELYRHPDPDFDLLISVADWTSLQELR